MLPRVEDRRRPKGLAPCPTLSCPAFIFSSSTLLAVPSLVRRQCVRRLSPNVPFHALQDPQQRLGAVAGADEIKQHPWFAGINWALVHNEKPPFRPNKAIFSPMGSTGEPSCVE